jgi:flagellar biosynthesis protein FliR
LRTAPRPLVGLGVAIALATALGIGLHRPLVLAIVETFGVFSLGEPQQWLALTTVLGTPWLLRALHGALLLALALATPVLLTAAVVEVALGLVGQGPGPAAVVMAAVRPWLRTAGGLVALGASWAAYGAVWAGTALP